MIIILCLNQILWCDHHWNCLKETIPMSGHTIGFGLEIRKLTFWKLSIFRPYLLPWLRYEGNMVKDVSNPKPMMWPFITLVSLRDSELQIRCVKWISINSICVVSSPNPMFDHLLKSSQWDDSNKCSNIGFGEEIGN